MEATSARRKAVDQVIDPALCTDCGACAAVCPAGIFEVEDKTAWETGHAKYDCLRCGTCVAVCPPAAIRVAELTPEGFTPIGRRPMGIEDLEALFLSRRSVRLFKDQPVDRGLIDRILAASATAPMGIPPHTTEVLVVDRPEDLDLILKTLVEDYDQMIKLFRSAIGRFILRRAAGAETFLTLKDFVIPLAVAANAMYRKDGSDRYLYRAPALLLFHANRWAIAKEENAHLVATYAMIAAQALGLGTTILGIVPPIVDRNRALKVRLGIPEENRVITSLILGHPRHRFHRAPSRQLKSVRYL